MRQCVSDLHFFSFSHASALLIIQPEGFILLLSPKFHNSFAFTE